MITDDNDNSISWLFWYVYFKSTGLHTDFQTELNCQLKLSKIPSLHFLPLINQTLSSDSSHSVLYPGKKKFSPILNINTNNKPLFPWVLCDSSKLLLFTSCILFGGGACWKATAHSAQQHNTLEPITAATQTSRRKDLFVRENKWSNCAKVVACAMVWGDNDWSRREKEDDREKEFNSLSHVSGL